MLVRPQHLQQYDRWIEQLVENRVAGLIGYGWGVRTCAFDRGLLALGQLAVTELEAILPDGTARDDVNIIFQGRGARPMVLNLRALTGVVTAKVANSSASSGH